MSSPAFLLSMLCLLAPAWGDGDGVVAPGRVAVATAADAPCCVDPARAMAWRLPAPAPTRVPIAPRTAEQPRAAETEAETEPQEDSGGSGAGCPWSRGVVPARPGSEARPPNRLPPGRSAIRDRSTTRLRC